MNDRFKQQCGDMSDKLRRLANAAPAIARASVGAGLSTLAKSAKRAAIGGIKQEVGWYIRRSGNKAWGRAGLMQYPERGQQGPHGLFIDLGTKYVTARHLIGAALGRAMPAARRAMERAAQSRINRVFDV